MSIFHIFVPGGTPRGTDVIPIVFLPYSHIYNIGLTDRAACVKFDFMSRGLYVFQVR